MATSSSTMLQGLGNPPSEKLTRANHLLWKAQVMPAFRGARMLGLLNGKEAAPSETMTVEKEGKEVTVDNPAYDRWIELDQRALSYLLGSLSPDILTQTIGLDTSAEVWALINSIFASKSKASRTSLRGGLSNTKKLDMTADQYVAKMRGFAIELIAAGRDIDDEELVEFLLNGLDEEYDGLVSAVLAMDTCSVSDLHGLLAAHDMRQEMLSGGGQKGFESSDRKSVV